VRKVVVLSALFYGSIRTVSLYMPKLSYVYIVDSSGILLGSSTRKNRSYRVWFTFLRREHDSLFLVIQVGLAAAAGGRMLGEAAFVGYDRSWNLVIGAAGGVTGMYAMCGAT
jgi:hypothetical protein